MSQYLSAPYCHTCGTEMIPKGKIKTRYASKDGKPYFVQWFKCPKRKFWNIGAHFEDCSTGDQPTPSAKGEK